MRVLQTKGLALWAMSLLWAMVFWAGVSEARAGLLHLNASSSVSEGSVLELTITSAQPRAVDIPFYLLLVTDYLNPGGGQTASAADFDTQGWFLDRLWFGWLPADQVATTVRLPVRADDMREGPEQLRVDLLTAGGRESARIVIEDDGFVTIPENFVLEILHVNDHHSRLDPTPSTRLRLAGMPTDVETGGFARVVSAINEWAQRAENVLKLHAGDALTGTIYYSLFKGEPDALLMNRVCFDAFTLGNHEFDDSDAGLAQFLAWLHADPRTCATAVLGANVVPAVGTPLQPMAGLSPLQPYVIKTFGNQRVGIIGITIAGKTKNSSSPLSSTQFLDETATAQRFIDELTQQGVNKIVLLTHLGYDNDLALAARLRGVDVIVGGDSHTLLGQRFADLGLNPLGPYPTVTADRDGRQVCVVQGWQYAEIVGHLRVVFDPAGQVVHCDGTPRLLLGDRFRRDGIALSGEALRQVLSFIAVTPELSIVREDPASVALLRDYRTRVAELRRTVVGVASENLCFERVPGRGRSTLCPRGATQANGGDIQQLVTEAYLRRSFEADVAIQNAGGVRIDVPAGEITIDTVYTLLPFANTLVNLDLRGKEIKQVLEEAVANFMDRNGSDGSYPYAANLRWHLDLSQPAGMRFSKIEMRRKGSSQWVPLEDEARVTVVTNSFIAAGRDGYLTFGTATAEGRAVDTFIDYAQGFIDYLQQNLGGAAPGAPFLSQPPLVRPVPCADYSTQVFIDAKGVRLDPDPTVGRACERR